jgi:3-oxoacyl-[acyl-carrier protein] reductase
MATDLMAEGAPTRTVEEAVAGSGSFDIVVHNLGGTLSVTDALCTIEEWRRVWRFNFEIAAEINRQVIPGMQSRNWGRIVHISSIAAVRGHSSVAYAAVKASLNAYARDLGRAVAPHGVVVTAVMPGAFVAEGGTWDTLSREDPGRARNYIRERIASQRFGTPEEISELVVFLCSEQASFLAGAVIPIDGGTW